jgi:hypothetical protein
MARKSSRRLTEQERAERRRQDRERLHRPLPVKERDRLTKEETGETMVLFRTVFVFDRAQVDPIEGKEQAPLGPPCEPLTGDSHAHLLAPIRVFAESPGFSVSFESIPGETGGWCAQKARRIVVDADAPADAQLRILIPWRRRCIRTFGMPGERSVASCLLPEPRDGPARRRGLATVVAEPRA